MESFLIKSFNGGLADNDDKGLSGAFNAGSYNLDIRKKKDSLSAQQGLTDDLAAGTFTAAAPFIVVSADGNAYFAVGTKIYRRTSAGVYSLQHTDTAGDGNINGMGEWVNSAGDTFIYYTTNTRLNRKRVLGTGYTPGDHDDPWDDVNATVNGQTYPKTNLTSSTWHTMAVVNGSLLIANYNTLAKVGYDDSYTYNAVQLYPGNIAKTLIESGVIAKIGANRLDDSEESMLFIWDTGDQNFTDKMQFPFSDINAIVETEVGIVQFGSDGGLYFFGDTAKVPVTSFPEGGQVDPGGVVKHEGLALFGVYGNGDGYSGIYSYGRKRKNDNFTLNCEYQFDCDQIYAVAKIGSDILFTYKDGTNYGVKKVNTAAKASEAIYKSLVLKPPRKLQKSPLWTLAVLKMDPLPSGCSVEVWRRINRGTWYQCNYEGGDTSYATTGGAEATFFIGDSGDFFELQIVLNSSSNSSPEIYEAQIFFEQ